MAELHLANATETFIYLSCAYVIFNYMAILFTEQQLISAQNKKNLLNEQLFCLWLFFFLTIQCLVPYYQHIGIQL